MIQSKQKFSEYVDILTMQMSIWANIFKSS